MQNFSAKYQLNESSSMIKDTPWPSGIYFRNASVAQQQKSVWNTTLMGQKKQANKEEPHKKQKHTAILACAEKHLTKSNILSW